MLAIFPSNYRTQQSFIRCRIWQVSIVGKTPYRAVYTICQKGAGGRRGNKSEEFTIYHTRTWHLNENESEYSGRVREWESKSECDGDGDGECMCVRVWMWMWVHVNVCHAYVNANANVPCERGWCMAAMALKMVRPSVVWCLVSHSLPFIRFCRFVVDIAIAYLYPVTIDSDGHTVWVVMALGSSITC